MLFVHPGTACKWSDHVTSSLLYYLAILIDTQSTSHCVILIWWYAMCQRIASFILHEESGIDSQCRALYVSPSGDISPLFSRISSSPRWSSVAGLVRASILSSTFIAQYFNSVFKNISIFQQCLQGYFNISTVFSRIFQYFNGVFKNISIFQQCVRSSTWPSLGRLAKQSLSDILKEY